MKTALDSIISIFDHMLNFWTLLFYIFLSHSEWLHCSFSFSFLSIISILPSALFPSIISHIETPRRECCLSSFCFQLRNNLFVKQMDNFLWYSFGLFWFSYTCCKIEEELVLFPLHFFIVFSVFWIHVCTQRNEHWICLFFVRWYVLSFYFFLFFFYFTNIWLWKWLEFRLAWLWTQEYAYIQYMLNFFLNGKRAKINKPNKQKKCHLMLTFDSFFLHFLVSFFFSFHYCVICALLICFDIWSVFITTT